MVGATHSASPRRFSCHSTLTTRLARSLCSSKCSTSEPRRHHRHRHHRRRRRTRRRRPPPSTARSHVMPRHWSGLMRVGYLNRIYCTLDFNQACLSRSIDVSRLLEFQHTGFAITIAFVVAYPKSTLYVVYWCGDCMVRTLARPPPLLYLKRACMGVGTYLHTRTSQLA